MDEKVVLFNLLNLIFNRPFFDKVVLFFVIYDVIIILKINQNTISQQLQTYIKQLIQTLLKLIKCQGFLEFYFEKCVIFHFFVLYDVIIFPKIGKLVLKNIVLFNSFHIRHNFSVSSIQKSSYSTKCGFCTHLRNPWNPPSRFCRWQFKIGCHGSKNVIFVLSIPKCKNPWQQRAVA